MVMDLWGRWRGSVVLFCALRAACLLAQTDRDAITFPVPTNGNIQIVGYFNGGIGWSFVANTNLLVTWVGSWSIPLLGVWPTDDELTFWTSPTTPIATYSADQIATPLDWETNQVGVWTDLSVAAGGRKTVLRDSGCGFEFHAGG
jgi:hypothetical protein